MDNKEDNEEFMVSFEDSPVDMTKPQQRPVQSNSIYDRRLTYEENKALKTKEPFIQKVTGVMVAVAMVVMIAFLGYLVTLGNFDLDKYFSLCKSVAALIYGIFIIDAIVMYGINKRMSIIMIAIFLPVFYPLKRSYVTSDRKNVQAIWLVVVFVLAGFTFSNVYTQVAHKVELIKTSADDYSSEYNDAVKYLKGQQVNDKTIIEIVKKSIDDYKWEAAKGADNSYLITLKGNSEIIIPNVISADALYNNNTKIVFSVNSGLSEYKIVSLTINGNDVSSYANDVWKQLCQ